MMDEINLNHQFGCISRLNGMLIGMQFQLNFVAHQLDDICTPLLMDL